LQSEYIYLTTTFYLFIVLGGKALLEAKRSPVAVTYSNNRVHASYIVVNKQYAPRYLLLTFKIIQSKDQDARVQNLVVGCFCISSSCTGH